ncbi:Cysteine proteinases superfamily protein [Trifolium repens]|nr:Cysteine proteinases superfamily protein [Trifolium repens]
MVSWKLWPNKATVQIIERYASFMIGRFRRKLPLSHDWRNHEGVLTESRNQTSTCTRWTFAITHAIQAALRLYRGISVTLSKQELLDCSYRWKDGSGRLDMGYNYISNHGINLQKVYSYESYKKMRRRPLPSFHGRRGIFLYDS